MVLPVAKMHGNNDETTPLYADSSGKLINKFNPID